MKTGGWAQPQTSTNTASSPTQTPNQGNSTNASDGPTQTLDSVISTNTPSGPVEEKAAEAAHSLIDILMQWGFPQWTARLLIAILVLFIAWYASRLVSQLMGRRVARRFQRPSVSRTVLRSIRLSVIAIGVLFIIGNVYGISVGNIALSVTVFSAVVGVVLAPIVGSIISGLLILADQPYEVGDMIEIVDTGQQGFVEDITIRYTKVFTLDNTFLVIPNGSMRERDVINYSAEDTRTRLHLDIGVTYESNLDEARRLIEDAAREVDTVIREGPDIRIGSSRYPAAPTCYIDQFAGSSVQLRLRYWVREPYRLLTLRSNIQENVWARLEDADVEIAYPHSHVVFDDTSGQLNVAMEDQKHNGEQSSQPSPTRSRIDNR
jgi:small conductance mechanosensitive channel